jgi:hypothetical protein
MTAIRIAASILCAAALLRAGDPNRIKAEPNLEKRSRLALENAEEDLTEARARYLKGDMSAAPKLLTELSESVEVARDALRETHKDPSKKPKHFKYAEIRTRDLLRRLDSFEQEMSVADRTLIAPVKERIQQTHDEILLGIMGKKK